MTRFLLIAAVCYCAYCAQLAVGLEHNVRRDHIEGNVDINIGRFDNSGGIYKDSKQEDLHVKYIEKNVPKKLRDRRKTSNSMSDDSPFSELSLEKFSHDLTRTKRSANDHGHAKETANFIGKDENAAVFVRKLFEQFGDGEKQIMNAIGFEKMLKHLGLYRMMEENGVENKDAESGVSGASNLDRRNEVVSHLLNFHNFTISRNFCLSFKFSYSYVNVMFVSFKINPPIKHLKPCLTLIHAIDVIKDNVNYLS